MFTRKLSRSLSIKLWGNIIYFDCLGPLPYLLPKTCKLFGFPICWLWAYLMNVISFQSVGYERTSWMLFHSNLLAVSVPHECYFIPICWLWAYLMNVISFQSVGYDRTSWMLFQKCVVYTKAMTYHLPCNKSNTTGGRCGAGTTYPSRTSAFSPVFICISSSCVVHVVKLNVFMFLVTCCDIGYDFHIRRCPIPLGYHVFCRGFVLCSCYLYLFTYTVVQHDFHSIWCLCLSIVTRRVSHVEQELLTLLEHLSLYRARFVGAPCYSIISFLYIVLNIIVCPFSTNFFEISTCLCIKKQTCLLHT
jgi:hypothetical protein